MKGQPHKNGKQGLAQVMDLASLKWLLPGISHFYYIKINQCNRAKKQSWVDNLPPRFLYPHRLNDRWIAFHEALRQGGIPKCVGCLSTFVAFPSQTGGLIHELRHLASTLCRVWIRSVFQKLMHVWEAAVCRTICSVLKVSVVGFFKNSGHNEIGINLRGKAIWARVNLIWIWPWICNEWSQHIHQLHFDSFPKWPETKRASGELSGGEYSSVLMPQRPRVLHLCLGYMIHSSPTGLSAPVIKITLQWGNENWK